MRKIIAGLIIFVLVVLAVGTLARSSVYQDCVSASKSASAHWDCLGPFTHENHGPITAIFTVLLGLATIFLWLATRDLVDNAERTSQRQLRAYVFPDTVDAYDKGNLPGVARNEALEGYVVIHTTTKNSGQTPAYEVIHWGGIAVRRIDPNCWFHCRCFGSR
jgi:hypothetical protein